MAHTKSRHGLITRIVDKIAWWIILSKMVIARRNREQKDEHDPT